MFLPRTPIARVDEHFIEIIHLRLRFSAIICIDHQIRHVFRSGILNPGHGKRWLAETQLLSGSLLDLDNKL